MDHIFPAIETPRLRLRCVEDRDAAALSSLMTPAISNWVASWPSPLPIDAARDRIAKARNTAAKGHAVPLVIAHRAGDDAIGWAAVNRSQEDGRQGLFGYWLGAPSHGQGYMREAAPAVLRAGFRILDVAIIAAGAQVANAASLAVLKGCGMRFVDERMIHAPARGRDELCAWYEITAAEDAAARP